MSFCRSLGTWARNYVTNKNKSFSMVLTEWRFSELEGGRESGSRKLEGGCLLTPAKRQPLDAWRIWIDSVIGFEGRGGWTLTPPFTAVILNGENNNIMLVKLHVLLPIPEILIVSIQENICLNNKILRNFVRWNQNHTIWLRRSQGITEPMSLW